MEKCVVFDWFTIFKFHRDFMYGYPRTLARYFITKLISRGWRVYIFRPNILCASSEVLRRKVVQFGIPSFEILYGLHSLGRLPFNSAVYVDTAYYYLIGGYWLALWVRRLRILRKVGNL